MKLMYVTTKPIWESEVPFDYPVPLVGDCIEIGELGYFTVRSRVWSLSRREFDAHWRTSVAVHVSAPGRRLSSDEPEVIGVRDATVVER